MRTALILAMLLLAVPAAAQTVAERFRAALALTDPLAFEAALVESRQSAEASGEIVAFWGQFDRAFDTTHPDRIALIRAWRDALPDSAYAMTAEALARVKLAYLIRGGLPSRYVPDDAMRGFAEQRDKAADLAGAAIEADPGAVSAYYVLFSAYRAGRRDIPLSDLVDTLLDITPSRPALQAAVSALEPRWGGSFLAQGRLCAAHAHRIEGYDAEACQIAAVLKGGYDGPELATARRALADRDDAVLDDLRYGELMRHGGIAELGEEGVRDWLLPYHRAQLGAGLNAVDWLADAEVIAMNARLPLYQAEAVERAEFALPAFLKADPYDYRLMADFIEKSSNPAFAAALGDRAPDLRREAWLNGMVYGRRNSNLWLLGARVMADSPLDSAPFVTNALVAADGRPDGYASAMDYYVGVRDFAEQAKAGLVSPVVDHPDPDTVLTTIQCPMARVARLLVVACTTARDEPYCGTHSKVFQAAGAMSGALERGDVCPEIAVAPIEALEYREWVTVPELEAFLANVPRGFE